MLESFIRTEEEDIKWWKENLEEAPEKYVGDTLKAKMAELKRWIAESEIKIEAYKLALKS